MRGLVLVIWFTAGLTAGRKVLLPSGPLIRVEGQPVSLRCEVSDYEGPKEQEFEWKSRQGSESVPIASTFDSAYSDQSVKGRVESGDVSVVRLGDSVVELRIREARVNDSATYTCSTPSTDSVFSGNYSADVVLRVIPNTLHVTPLAPAPSVHEGNSASLLCNVSSDSADGIYLSVTWSVRPRQGGPERDLLTLGPGLAIAPGVDFSGRYEDGGMRARAAAGGPYVLELTRARVADDGTYVCTAGLWTVEQGGWNRIQEKAEVIGEVAVVPTAKSLVVEVGDTSPVAAGDDLGLTCSVSAGDRSSLGLEVTWLLNGTRVLAHLDRDGVESRASAVHSLSRAAGGDFRLQVRRAEASDAGLYSCRVRAWIRLCGGAWYQAAETTSAPVQVTVAMADVGVSVTLDSPVTAQNLGDPTELACRVSGASRLRGQKLGVAWFHSGHAGGDAHAVVVLDENGALTAGEGYAARLAAGLIVTTRAEPATFRLRLLRTAGSDAGAYTCAVTAWAPDHLGEWRKAAEYRARPLDVEVAKGIGVSVVARRTQPATSMGSPFEMTCQARRWGLREDAPLSVVLLTQAAVGSPGVRLASLSPELVLRPGERGQGSAGLVKSDRDEFRFSVASVGVADRGFYFCVISAWSRSEQGGWVEEAKGESNKVQISFDYTRPSFELEISSDTTDVHPWETVRVECVLRVLGTPPKSDDVAFEVRWYLRRLPGRDPPTLLASTDRWGVVRKGPRNASSDCSAERAGARAFALSVHGTQDSDAGEYYCAATPWTRPGPGGAWGSEPEIRSRGVFLSVKFALWDSMRLPLLYGACTSLLFGLFSLVLGAACTRCCGRDAAAASATRMKLINLQAD